jgi:uncharacterized protein YjiS (DUF1127 family)
MAIVRDIHLPWLAGTDAAAELATLQAHQTSQQNPSSLARALASVAAPFRYLSRREETLQELLRLDARMLADVGLHRSDIYVAAAKAARD